MRTVVYRRFTRNWEKYRPNYPDLVADNDGIPGPTIRARVGDTVFVHFKNMDTFRNARHSMHFHGFRYQFPSDGSYIPGVSGRGANLAPGQTFTYRLEARRGSRGTWPYHDHSSTMTESIDGGMYGALLIYGRNEKHVKRERENVVFLMTHLGFMTINGRAFPGNTPTFRARRGDLVEWNVLALGSDFHTFHLHGHRWRWNGQNVDTRTIGPAESFRFRIREDAPGTWFYHCHVEAHMMTGMQGFYRVRR
jgi:FtsP/CotA-like multicopper oxidase with cupredoxin domain